MERTTHTGDAEGPSWAEVFGAFDARMSTPEQRGAFIDELYRKAMGQREYWLSGAGEEAMWTWSAAAQAFTQGNWIAATLCCHAVCERALAGRFTSFWMDEDDAPSRWQQMGLGRLLAELEKRDAIHPEAAEKLRRIADYRKPFGHWKNFTHPTSLYERARSLLSEDNELDSEEAALRLIVEDATRAIEITAEVLYGDPWGDTDRANAAT